MISGFRDPFEALFAMQKALESRLASDWMGGRTAGMGSYPPINVFQRGDGFVAVIELPGIDKNDIEIEAKENTIRISGRKVINYDQAAKRALARAPVGRVRPDALGAHSDRPGRH